MDVFTYYPPTTSVYHEVKIGGDTGERRPNEDSKFVGTDIKIGASLDVAGLIKAHVGFVKSKAESAAQGYRGHAEVHGKEAIAAAFGIDGQSKGEVGDWLALAEWKCTDTWHIETVKTVLVDGKKIKADTWYKLQGGEFVEAEE